MTFSQLTLCLLRPCVYSMKDSPWQLCYRLKSHYQALGVPQNATKADIKAAYYKLSMLYHPDKNESSEAAEAFREITEAYEVIGNYKLRKLYDKGLLGHVADEGTRRTYSNYSQTSSSLKNKPTHHDRASIYNFDEWSRVHYGGALNKRQESKIRYEEKVAQSGSAAKEAKNENIVYVVAVLTSIGFILTYSLENSYDTPISPKKK